MPGRNRPSASTRSESGLSTMSFQTAADNDGHDITSADEDGEYEIDPDASKPHQDSEVAVPHRSPATPGLTMSSDDEEDANQSGETLSAEEKHHEPVLAAATPVVKRTSQVTSLSPATRKYNNNNNNNKVSATNINDDTSDYNSPRRSYLDPVLDNRRDSTRYRSQSDRGTGGRNSRMLPSDSGRRGGPPSSRGSFQSERRTALSDQNHGGGSLRLPSSRRQDDNLSLSSRMSRATSVTSRMLDPETQVFPGTRIKRYIEPTLTDAMRRVMKQFSASGAAYLDDHRCIGYPIAVFVGATAIDVGSIINPIISGAVAMYFAPGHPKNMAALLPAEDRTPAHIPNPKAPNTTSLSRRAELRAVITALDTVYELYRGRACAHVCIDSAYVAKSWGTWIPTWEADGWPGQEREEYDDREDYYDRYSRRASSRNGYASSEGRRSRTSSRRGYSKSRRYESDYTSEDEMEEAEIPRDRKLVDEDLLRELADVRYEYGRIERDRLGSAHMYLLDRSHNPADKMARAVARNEAQLVQELGTDANAIGLNIDDAELSDTDGRMPYDDDENEADEWADSRSRISRLSANTTQSRRRGQSVSSLNSRNSITSNATSARKLRNSASLPAGNLRGQPRRQLDTFAEEDEYNLSNDSAGLAGAGAAASRSQLDVPISKSGADRQSLHSERSRSTRAERERDLYLARQEQDDRRRSKLTQTGSRILGLPSASDRGAGRRSMDVENTRRVSLDTRRTSMDSRRRTSLSQPDLRNRFVSPAQNDSGLRGALASAASRDSRRSFQQSRRRPTYLDEEEEEEEQDRLASRKKYLTPTLPRDRRATRSTPSLSRSSAAAAARPAPEDEEYDWKPLRKSTSRRPPPAKATTAGRDREFRPRRAAPEEEDRPTLTKKKSFFRRLFSRKSKA